MYEAIDQATQATVDPLPKDERKETVMGKIDCELSLRLGELDIVNTSTEIWGVLVLFVSVLFICFCFVFSFFRVRGMEIP